MTEPTTPSPVRREGDSPTAPDESPTARNVEYKGAPLDSARGPGLGCFWSQVVVLAILLVLTPLSVAWEWPTWVSGALLILVLVLLLFAGQTVIFLLRLVAADRRAAGRRRPLASPTPTVGEIEDRAPATGTPAPATGAPTPAAGAPKPSGAPQPAPNGAMPSTGTPALAPGADTTPEDGAPADRAAAGGATPAPGDPPGDAAGGVRE